MQQIIKAIRPKGRLSDLLRKYEGRIVGLHRPATAPPRAMTLLKVQDDHITLYTEGASRVMNIPLRRIDHVEEGTDGETTDAVVDDQPLAAIITLANL